MGLPATQFEESNPSNVAPTFGVVARKNPFRLIPKFEESTRVQQFFSTMVGQAALAFWASAILFCLSYPGWWMVGPAILLMNSKRVQRYRLLLVLSLIWPFINDVSGIQAMQQNLQWISIARTDLLLPYQMNMAGLAMALGFLFVSRAAAKSKEFKPILLRVHGAIFLATFLCTAALLRETFWCWVVVLLWARYFWYFNYSLRSLQEGNALSPWQDLATFRPIWVQGAWSAGILPSGKAARALDRFSYKDEVGRITTQIKGLKLIVWALILYGLREIMLQSVEPSGVLSFIPSFDSLLTLEQLQAHPPWYINWLAILWNFIVHDLLDLAFYGHMIVGVARLFGFMMPRQMCRPVGSTNLVDFYNRYLYYFKEILNDFFFMPMFLYLRKMPLAKRMAISTFFTICLGNVFYHLLYRPVFSVFVMRPLPQALAFVAPYFFVYFVVLALGLTVSQLRRLKGQNQNQKSWHRVFAQFNTVLFFILLSVFNLNHMRASIVDNFHFFLGLFGF